MIRSITFSLFFICFSFASANAQVFNGMALYNSLNSSTAYLVDENSTVRHTWSCSYSGNYAVLLLDNGNIMRGGVVQGTALSGAAKGGILQELDHQANPVWSFPYHSNTYIQHHDICLMPNGGLLFTAWETKTVSELQAMGYTGNSAKWPTHFVEIQPDGSGGANIVWEWHIWDHLIQDTDVGKPNYGVVSQNPQLLDINVPTSGFGGPWGGDWFHVNGIDYNDSLDQIVFSSRFLSEIFVIDHSTTTAEAASHSGGNSGMGGDILYRYGNPSNYGAPGAQVIPAACHDTRWLPYDGRPNAGYIQFFNNEGASGGGSSVDAINPPHTGYTYALVPGQAYAPSSHDWRHNCIDNANGQSASDRLSNGNTFVNLSGKFMYEVDSNDVVVWQYPAGPAKAFRYECDHPGLTALLGTNPCNLVGVEEIRAAEATVYPNPSTGVINISGVEFAGNKTLVEVFDFDGKLVRSMQYQDQIDLSDQSSGLYIVKISEENRKPISKMISINK
ncbi:MAG: T9SS type A sorting domain-containing protein [Bacteroidia bacterium]|nr:T9SS type A sorting domain-containing protein [Bacteroidia bacterium]